MKFKSFAVSTIAAVALATTVSSASATTMYSTAAVNGTSFSDTVIGTIHISSLSDLSGNLFAASTISYQPFPGFSLTLSLDSVSFSSGTVGALVDSNASATDFSFHNVAAGDYVVKASGSLLGNGQVSKVAFLGANYSVTAVPEPESYAMLLAGLGLMGAIARRRKQSKAG